MNPKMKLWLFLGLLLLDATKTHAQSSVLSIGHTDLAVAYDSTIKSWDVHVGSDTFNREYAASDVVLQVNGTAKTTIPANSKFNFLGSAGDPIWILPQAQNETLLYLGYGGEDIPDGVFVNNQVKVTLKDVSGPGDFFSYKVDGFGNPVVDFNTKDGISDTKDFAIVQAGGDAHVAWAFTAVGDYTITVDVSGVLVAGASPTSSGPVTFNFTVLPAPPTALLTGHTDIAIDYDSTSKIWDLHVGYDVTGQEFAASEVLFQVNPEAKTTVPGNPKFSFLGKAGDPIWILTQAEDDKLLYLGYGGDGIPDGAFDNNHVKVTLKNVSGPGDFFSYTVDGFGNPVVSFNTRDGISPAADFTMVQAGGDAHVNWAFTAAGDYTVTLEASGMLSDGNVVTSSGPVDYKFKVFAPIVPLADEHTDLRVLYDPAATNNFLSIVARDENHLVNYRTNETVLVVAESAKLNLPDGTPFGPGGSPIWVLPQSQTPGLLYLGLSAEDIPLNAFSGPLKFQLKAVSGPGDFFLWQAASNGGLNIHMNTADGIDASDIHNQIVGSHEHFNFGFTTNGTYQVTFQVTARRVGESTNITSLDSTFTFNVLPLPIGAPPRLAAPAVTGQGGLAFDLLGTVGMTYRVEGTTDFKTWIEVRSVRLDRSPTHIVIEGPGSSHRFFRATAP